MDGRTLWFASRRMLVTLRQIDSCDLPQWAFDPRVADKENALYPVPCGSFAKAWLKRTIGDRVVRCTLAAQDSMTAATGTCKVAGRDLAYEMLRVGWARLATPLPRDNRYFEAQSHAVAARYGMWATYVLDMSEWRRKAIDKTLGRRPIADLNLLSERRSEVSPPFADARRQPSRRDR
ncbi:nuclease [Rhizobium sp. Root482]|nr:nuclease [Rhizobium sp. Root482]